MEQYLDKDTELLQKSCDLIEKTFLSVVSIHLAKVPITQRRAVVDHLFTLFKDLNAKSNSKKENIEIST